MTTPNLISLARALAGVVVLLLLTNPSLANFVIAIAIMIVAELSDVLDGVIARYFGETSELGRYLDPTCDTLYHVFVFLGFLANGWASPWTVLLIYSVEIVIPYLRTLARQNGTPLAASGWTEHVKNLVHGIAQVTSVGVWAWLLQAGEPNTAAWLGIATSNVAMLCAAAASLLFLGDTFIRWAGWQPQR